MKKFTFLIVFLLLVMGCSNNTNYKVSDFFVAGDFEYKGGFEGAGFKTSSKYINHNGHRFIVENITDTATTVQKIYLITKNSIDLVFTGEDTSADLATLNLNTRETVLKLPFKIGNNWTSAGNRYEIIDFIDAESGQEITVEKTYSNGNVERIIYQKGFGKISRVLILGS